MFTSSPKITNEVLRDRQAEKIAPFVKVLANTQDGCVTRKHAERVYGKNAVERAIHDGHVTQHTVVVRDPSNTVPDERVAALVTDQWDKSKPKWLK